mmetsp:Transcript_42722/g.41048  ORF Transcript_42722/g.41048 Transcript_42722/m.41048 type:complete len:119 (-) Transcript_42722:2078-2434(-)
MLLPVLLFLISLVGKVLLQLIILSLEFFKFLALSLYSKLVFFGQLLFQFLHFFFLLLDFFPITLNFVHTHLNARFLLDQFVSRFLRSLLNRWSETGSGAFLANLFLFLFLLSFILDFS